MNMEREERMNLEEAEALALRIAEDDEMYAVILGIFPLHSSGRNYYILCCTPSGWVFAVLNRLMWETRRAQILQSAPTSRPVHLLPLPLPELSPEPLAPRRLEVAL